MPVFGMMCQFSDMMCPVILFECLFVGHDVVPLSGMMCHGMMCHFLGHSVSCYFICMLIVVGPLFLHDVPPMGHDVSYCWDMMCRVDRWVHFYGMVCHL